MHRGSYIILPLGMYLLGITSNPIPHFYEVAIG
jgi:hypothetical protein